MSIARATGPRIVLVQPHQEINVHPVPRKRTKVLGRYLSLGIASIAAYLRTNGYPDVHAIDSASPLLTYEGFEAKNTFQILLMKDRMVFLLQHNMRAIDQSIAREEHNASVPKDK